jgi:hypothetical protein
MAASTGMAMTAGPVEARRGTTALHVPVPIHTLSSGPVVAPVVEPPVDTLPGTCAVASVVESAVDTLSGTRAVVPMVQALLDRIL